MATTQRVSLRAIFLILKAFKWHYFKKSTPPHPLSAMCHIPLLSGDAGKKKKKEENDKCQYYAEFAFLNSHSPFH